MLIGDLDVLGAIDIIHDDTSVTLMFVTIVVKRDITRETVISSIEKGRVEAKTKPLGLEKRHSYNLMFGFSF